MTHKKNYRAIMESLMEGQEGTRNFLTEDAKVILKRLGFKDITSELTRGVGRRERTGHNRNIPYTHPRLPELRLNISTSATLSWEDKDDFVKAVQKLLAVEPNALERLEPGYAARIAQEAAEQTFRQ